MEPPVPPPQVSPDGKFYWNGQGWQPMTGGTPPPPQAKAVTGIAIASMLALAFVALAVCTSFRTGMDLQVTSWHTGSADVAGTITNRGSGCTNPQITLHLLDHNRALVRDFTFGAGELAARETRNWTTHMVGFLFLDAPVEPNVTSISGAAECADRH